MHRARLLILLQALLVLMLGACTGERNGNEDLSEESSSEYAPATDFSLDEVGTDNKVVLSEHLGDVVVLNFWATWCGPCLLEMPMLVELQREYGSRGLQVIGISVDEEGSRIVEPFVEEFGFNYPIVVDEGPLAASYGAQYAVPTTVLVDRKGRVRSRVLGLVEKAELEALLRELLGED